MEVYAGFLSYTDYEIGRVVNYLKENNLLDNTAIFVLIGDNGASKEGTYTGTIGTAEKSQGEDISGASGVWSVAIAQDLTVWESSLCPGNMRINFSSMLQSPVRSHGDSSMCTPFCLRNVVNFSSSRGSWLSSHAGKVWERMISEFSVTTQVTL